MHNKSLKMTIARRNANEEKLLETLVNFVLPGEATDKDISIIREYQLNSKDGRLPEKYEIFLDIACSVYVG